MNYEELAAQRMRPRPSLTSAEEVIKKDFPLKLPNRTHIRLWNTPEVSQFRGYQENADEREERLHIIRAEQEVIGQQARIASDGGMPEMHIVHEMLNQQRQAGAALQQHAEQLAALNRQQLVGMQEEQRAEMTRLSNAHLEAQNRQRIAEGALVGLRDAALEQRNLIAELAARQGHVTNNIDQRHTTTNIDARQMQDVNVHSQAMNLMHSHAAQFGQYMQQQRLDQSQMLQLLYEHLRRNPPQQTYHHQPVIIHMQQPPPGPPGAPLAITTSSSSQPPPPPGGGGAIAEQARRLPKPAPEAAPMIPSAVPHFNIGTPPGSVEPLARRLPIRGKQPPTTPYAKQRSRSRAPWKSGMEDPPSLPKTPVLPPSSETGASSSSAPGAAAPEPAPPLPPPLEPPPLQRGRSAQRGRPRSTSGSQPKATKPRQSRSMETIRYPSRGRSVSIGDTETVRYPSEPPPSRLILPTIEDAEHEESLRRTRVLVRNKIAKVKAGDELRPALRPKPATSSQEAVVPKPKAKAKAKASPRIRIRKVPVTATETPKRGRGRPVGSLGRKKRDLLVEEELRRLATVP